MSERYYRLIIGPILLFILYLRLDLFIYGYIGLLIFEGVTNIRIPYIIYAVRRLFSGSESKDKIFNNKWNADRILRILVAGFLIVSVYVLPTILWAFPWFIGAMLMLAGITNICPMVLVITWLLSLKIKKSAIDDRIIMANDWTKNWQANIAVKVAAVLVWIIIIFCFIISIISLEYEKNTLLTRYNKDADKLALELSSYIHLKNNINKSGLEDIIKRISSDSLVKSINVNNDKLNLNVGLIPENHMKIDRPLLGFGSEHLEGKHSNFKMHAYFLPVDSFMVQIRNDVFSAISLGVLLFSLFLIFAINTIVNQPFQVLVNATKAIAKGKHQLRLDIIRVDEFGHLGRFFNKMLDKLIENQTKLELEISERRRIDKALKESEERYRDLFDNANDLIQSVDPSGKIIYVNSKWSELTGYSIEELKSMYFIDLIDDDHREKCTNIFEQVSSGENIKSYETVFKGKNGDVVYVEGNINARIKDGQFIATRGIFRDITERKKAELIVKHRTLELKQANKDLTNEVEERKKAVVKQLEAMKAAEAANKAKSIFLANMSHEIRTPLNAILGYAQILQRSSGLAREAQKAAHTIRRSGNHLLSLINDILDISKIEAGRMELHLNDFDLHALVSDLSAMFELKCKQKNISWVDKSEGIKDFIPVRGDEGKIRQILINLLGNAVKYTDNGFVSLKVKPNGNNNYTFEVKDTGLGISEEHQKSVFEPFQQSEGGVTKGGTGLGLAISKKQLELMDSTLKLESEESKGSNFYFKIPLIKAEENIKTRFNVGKKIIAIKDNVEIKALVVDDDSLNRDVLSSILKDIGIKIVEATDGYIAMERIESHNPDIVFMDFRMPGLNGIEAIKLIKEKYGDKIKNVIISASVFEHERKKYTEAGSDDMITKPFQVDEVYSCIADLLNIEYIYEETEYQTIEDEKGELQIDPSLITISNALWEKINEAAEYSFISDLKIHLKELEIIGEDEKQLSFHLRQLTESFNMDAVQKILNEVKHAK